MAIEMLAREVLSTERGEYNTTRPVYTHALTLPREEISSSV